MMNQYLNFKGLFLVVALVLGGFTTAFSQEGIGTEFKIKPAPKPKKEKKETAVKDVKFNTADYEKIKAYEVGGLNNNTYKVPQGEEKDPEKLAKRNQDLGVVKTTSGVAKVRYRDAAYVDGDKVRVYLNYEIVEQEVLLNGEAQGFDITLKKGVNRIDIEALNDGYAAPNTAEFKIYDDKGAVISSNQWNIAQGYKATIIIEKE